MSIKTINAYILICFFLFSCKNVDKKLKEEKSKSDTTDKIILPIVKGCNYYIDTTKFKFSCNDTLDLRFTSIKKYNYTKLLKLTQQDKKLYFRQFHNQFIKSDLYFFAHLKCNSHNESMVFLDVDKTDYRLIKISFYRYFKYVQTLNINDNQNWWYNNLNSSFFLVEDSNYTLFDFYKLQHIDTLISSYKNRTNSHEEYLAPHSKPHFGIITTINTKQINKSTYLIDTLKDREYVNSVIFNSNKLKKYYSVRNVIPKGKNIFREAIGDLNGDGIDDYAFALQNNNDDGTLARDLLIVFTRPQGYEVKTYIENCFSCKQCGGSFDPIDGTEDSGISIVKGNLIYKYFGGSAWKWEGDLKFTFSTELNDFFLTQERGRRYHSINIYESESELPYIEKLRKGFKLTKEEEEEYRYAKKGLEDYKYRITNYGIGKKSIHIALKSRQ